MKYCKHCNVKVDSSENYCPLCYNYLEELEPETDRFEYYLGRDGGKKRSQPFSSEIVFIHQRVHFRRLLYRQLFYGTAHALVARGVRFRLVSVDSDRAYHPQ